MTDRIRGIGFGRLAVAMIGVVAMVALATGAVAASGSPFKTAPANQNVVLADATDSAAAVATGSATAAASCDPTLDAAEDAAEKAAKASLAPGASLAPEASEPPQCKPVDNDEASESAKPTKAPAASCDPTLDQKEDAAEKAAKASAVPGASKAPEVAEPPQCAPAGIKGEGAGDIDGDSNANQNGIDGHQNAIGHATGGKGHPHSGR
jgi:hypothetical protein